MYGNFEYSLTGEQQSAIQLFLRMALSKKQQDTPEFRLLHELTYAQSWTPEPKYEVAKEEVQKFDFVKSTG